MAQDFSSIIRKLRTWFVALSQREKVIVSAALVGVILVTLYLPVSFLNEYIDKQTRETTRRQNELDSISKALIRYKNLNERLTKLQQTFDTSQLSFEQLSSEIDKITKDTLGGGDITLAKSGSPTKIGFEYEKQEYTLKVKAVSLKQLTDLLYRIEQGGSPLFLGKVDILKSSSKTDFSATLEIFSVRKSEDVEA